jgi:hypothetical protein
MVVTVAVGKPLTVGKTMRGVAVQTKGVCVGAEVQTGTGCGVTDQTSQALSRNTQKSRLIFLMLILCACDGLFHNPLLWGRISHFLVDSPEHDEVF